MRKLLSALCPLALLSALSPGAALADSAPPAAPPPATPTAAPTQPTTTAPAQPTTTAPAQPSTTAPAAPAAGAPSPARLLFEGGSKAYAAGNYRAAIQAFEQAYAVEARPGLLFSIAQAHRRQYRVDGRPGHVAVAIRRYNEYLAQLKQGGRRADAEAALVELTPIAQKLEQDGQLQPLSAQDIESATRLIITSPAPGAKIAVDDDKVGRPAPFIAEVTPGRHRIRVLADNHFEESREIDVPASAVTALDLPLKEKPAAITIEATSGARVSLDGRFVGEAPLAGPIEILSGAHDVSVSRAGYASFAQRLSVLPGQKLTVSAPLAMTLQRKVSIGLLGGGAAALAGGIVVGGFALAAQADASAVKGDMDQGKVVCRGATCPELDRYNNAVSARDAMRATSFTLLGAGALAGGAGIFLYLYDGLPLFGAPRDSAPAATSASTTTAAPARRADRTQTEFRLSGTPVITPDFAGAALSGTF